MKRKIYLFRFWTVLQKHWRLQKKYFWLLLSVSNFASLIYIYIYIYIYVREKLTVLTCWMFLQKEPSQMFDIGENSPLLYFLWQLYPIQKQFSRGGLFVQNLQHERCTLTNFKTSVFFVERLLMGAFTYHCWSLCYYCFASVFVLLLKK